LETLLQGEDGATKEEPASYDYESEQTPPRSSAPVTGAAPIRYRSDNITGSRNLQPIAPPRSFQRVASYGEAGSFSPESPPDDDEDLEQGDPTPRIPLHDQRTVLITNLPDRTTHKDLAGIVRGGRLLDIFLRNDKSATISFVKGAAEFLAHTKRNDIYLHMKRVRCAPRKLCATLIVSARIPLGGPAIPCTTTCKQQDRQWSDAQSRRARRGRKGYRGSDPRPPGSHPQLDCSRYLLQGRRCVYIDQFRPQRSLRQDLYDVSYGL
jgi:hypothetical protein